MSTRQGNETTGALLLLLFGDKELGVSLKRGGRRIILWGSNGWIFMLCWREMAENVPFTSSLGKLSLNQRDWIEKVCLAVRWFCWCFQNVAWIRTPICWVLRTFVISNCHSEPSQNYEVEQQSGNTAWSGVHSTLHDSYKQLLPHIALCLSFLSFFHGSSNNTFQFAQGKPNFFKLS